MTFIDGMHDLLASELEAEERRDGPPSDTEIAGAVQRPDPTVHGRWEVPARVGFGERRTMGCLVLRLDRPGAAGRLLSGDVFAELNLPGTRLRLGDRTDWAFGFVADLGDAVHLGDRLIMPCDLTAAVPGGAADDVCKGTIELRVSETGGIAEFRMTVLAETTGGWSFVNAVHASDFPEPEEVRRRIRLYVAATRHVRDTPRFADALKLVVDPDHRLGLVRALAAAGIEAEIDEERLAGLPELALPVTPKSYAKYVARAVPSLGAVARKVQLGPEIDWAHTLIFATHGADDDGVGKVLNYGESFGLGSSLSRFNSRNGAALNVTRLAMIAKDAPEANDVEQLAWTLRFTAMHELAHLLNMPHAWERAVGHRLLGESRPGALSWSNYPSRYPYGASAAAYFDSVREDGDALIGDVSRGEIVAKRRGTFARAFQAACDKAEKDGLPHGFDEAELRFIRHAPLPYIAQGGQTFLDGVLPQPRLGEPSKGRLQLAIRVPTKAGTHEARRIRLWTWLVRSDGQFFHQFPPVPAWVTLLKDGEPVGMRHEYFDFRFDSGAVQLFIAPGEGAEVSTPAISFSPEGIADAARTEEGLPFPWIARRMLFRQMNPVPDFLAVQAVFAVGPQTIRSPIVTLHFSGIRRLRGSVEPAELETNADRFAARRGDPPVAVLDVAVPIRRADYPGRAV